MTRVGCKGCQEIKARALKEKATPKVIGKGKKPSLPPTKLPPPPPKEITTYPTWGTSFTFFWRCKPAGSNQWGKWHKENEPFFPMRAALENSQVKVVTMVLESGEAYQYRRDTGELPLET